MRPSEQEMIATAVHWIELCRALTSHEASRRWVRARFREWAHAGGPALLHVLALGHEKNIDADIALRTAYADQLRAREYGLIDKACPFLETYVALPMPPHTKKGWAEADRYLRNRLWAALVARAIEEWGLPYSKSRESETISASAVISKAARLRGYNVGHRYLENLYREDRDLMPYHRAWRELEAQVTQAERDVAALGERMRLRFGTREPAAA